MKCILMNKNTKILSAELNSDNDFTKIYDIFNIDLAPLSIYNSHKNKYSNDLKTLNDWFKGRGIPSWRKDLENLLNKLNVNSPKELLNKAYGLSLSDQYWLKEDNNQNINWQDINFFTNNFDYASYLEASLSNDSKAQNISLISPNNTTDGMIQKAWIIENNQRILVKGTYTFSRQEPINEWLASRICQILKLDHVDYQIDKIDGKLVSKCQNFLNDNEEIISACDIFELKKKDNNTRDFNHYISILEDKGITNAKEKMQDMYIVDYLMMNIDRHMKNYGIIRNVETGEWIKTTPIFDTGQSLCCDKYLSELNFYNDKCKMFYSQTATFDDLLKYVELSRYNITSLRPLVKELHDELIKYQETIEMSDERINKITTGFSNRIEILVEKQTLN